MFLRAVNVVNVGPNETKSVTIFVINDDFRFGDNNTWSGIMDRVGCFFVRGQLDLATPY